jgi:hypothetical protein
LCFFVFLFLGERGVGTGGGTYVLRTETEEEASDWISIIQQQIMGKLSENSPDKTPPRSSSPVPSSNGGDDFFVPNEKILSSLFKANPYCVDCGENRPDWASINLCMMICINCSGIHRSLGTHISKVRSLHLDKWSNTLVTLLKEIGNVKANEIWEEKLLLILEKDSSSSSSASIRKEGDVLKLSRKLQMIRSKLNLLPTTSESLTAMEERETFIRLKYADRSFISSSLLSSSSEEDIFLFFLAVKEGKLLEVYKYLVRGVDVNTVITTVHDDTREEDFQEFLNYSPLMIAVKYKQVLIVDLCLQWNANVNLVNSEGKSALSLVEQALRGEVSSTSDSKSAENSERKKEERIRQLLLTSGVKAAK